MAAIVSVVTGRAVHPTIVGGAEWRAAKIAGGMPALYADMLIGTFLAARRDTSRRPRR